MANTKVDFYNTDGLEMQVSVPEGYSSKWITVRRKTKQGTDDVAFWFNTYEEMLHFGGIIIEAAMEAIRDEKYKAETEAAEEAANIEVPIS